MEAWVPLLKTLCCAAAVPVVIALNTVIVALACHVSSARWKPVLWALGFFIDINSSLYLVLYSADAVPELGSARKKITYCAMETLVALVATVYALLNKMYNTGREEREEHIKTGAPDLTM